MVRLAAPLSRGEETTWMRCIPKGAGLLLEGSSRHLLINEPIGSTLTRSRNFRTLRHGVLTSTTSVGDIANQITEASTPGSCAATLPTPGP